ncbi:MAG TPA: hypothetical protein VFZ58_02460 [Candidatus Saccharimonadales bacterium]
MQNIEQQLGAFLEHSAPQIPVAQRWRELATQIDVRALAGLTAKEWQLVWDAIQCLILLNQGSIDPYLRGRAEGYAYSTANMLAVLHPQLEVPEAFNKSWFNVFKELARRLNPRGE